MQPSGNATPNTPWRVLLVCPRVETSHNLRAALADLGIAHVAEAGEYPQPGAVTAFAARHDCNICFLDAATSQEQALRIIDELSASMPVVALHVQNDADLILRCLRRGACEFLSDMVPQALGEILQRLGTTAARAAVSPQQASRIYCVVPAKPGCGASTLAAHLAVQIRAGGASRVLLVDTDPLGASIGFMLNLKSEFNIGDALQDCDRLDDDLWSRLTLPACDVDVLLAPERPSLRLEIEPRVAQELAAFWRQRYEVTIIDSPDLRAADESGFAAAADEILLVVTNELSTLHAAKRVLDCLSALPVARERLRLIVNRYAPAAGLKAGDIQTALQIAPFAVVENDFQLTQTALLEGKPLPHGSRLRSNIQGLAQQLRGCRAAAKREGTWSRLLHRRK